MTAAPIRTALEAAIDAALANAWRARGHTDEAPVGDLREAVKSGAWADTVEAVPVAIVAFLRALPTGSGKGLFEFGDDDNAQCLFLSEAAAAVAAAAEGTG